MPQTESRPCPSCGKDLDGATPVGDDKEIVPEPGDVTICVYCATWLRLADDNTFELLDSISVAALRATEQGLKAEHVASIMRRMN